jgi:hypothetical protein
MTDLDTLLKDADPARHIAVPTPGSMHAERIWARVGEPSTRPVHLRRARWFVVPVVFAAAVVIALVFVGVASSPLGGRPTSVAAAALRRLAGVASAQPALTLTRHQYLHSHYDASIQAMFNAGSNPASQAIVNATIDQWSNLGTVTCTQATLGPATFSSSGAQEAWVGAGLLVVPSPATTSSCFSAGTVSSLNLGDAGAIDVSKLPLNPRALARELTRGKTGILRVDQALGSETEPDVAFQRAVVLLAEPTVGATPQFWSALLRAMSTFPGVKLLGTETTHSGLRGLAFAGENHSVQTVVVLSPSTGALLEARNIDVYSFQSLYASLQISFLPLADKAGEEAAGFQWLDPLGKPIVVDSVPPTVGQLPPVPSASIDVTTKPGTTEAEVNALMQDTRSQLGGASTGTSDTGTGGVFHLEITLDGKANHVKAFVKALRASSIVASVVVHTS